MYLELKFRKVEVSKKEAWELYHTQLVENKTEESAKYRVKKVYIDDVAYMAIPSIIDKIPVVSIANSVRIPTFVENVIIPDSVTLVAEYAFTGAQAETLRIGEGINNLDFLINFEYLKRLALSPHNRYFRFYENNLYSDDRNTLYWASNADIWDETKIIAQGAFNRFKAYGLSLPTRVESISHRAFNKAQIGEIHLPASVKSIAMEAFYNCTIDTLVIGEKIRAVNAMTFHLCDIGMLVFREGDVGLSFEKHAIYSCKINSLVLPERTILIQTKAFNISKLESIRLAGRGYKPFIFDNDLIELTTIEYHIDSMEESAKLCFGHSGLKNLLQNKSFPLTVVKDGDKWMEEMYW